jgi:hypothetical protein
MRQLTYAQFLSHCQSLMPQLGHQSEADLHLSEDYLSGHDERFCRTYEVCLGLLESGGMGNKE